jgi:hypothetical protein
MKCHVFSHTGSPVVWQFCVVVILLFYIARNRNIVKRSLWVTIFWLARQLLPQTVWPIAKSLTNRDGPRAPTAFHGLLDLKYHSVDKANTIADCLEHQFTLHDLCEENHEWRVEARVQALLEAADSDPPERIRPCDSQKLLNSLKLKKECGIDGIPNECLRHLPRISLVHLTHLINLCFRL